ncbi:MAG TPA: hypothetical protein VGO03_16255 [Acidimicrobiia bacterium]
MAVPSLTNERQCTVEQARKRRRIEIVWVVLTVLYGIGRAVVVGLTLSRYGVNPWIYGAIDATTSVPLGFGTARATTAAIDRRWRSAREWGFIAAVAFIAPDVSIFVMGGGRLPKVVFFIVAGVVLLTGSFAVHEARVKIRAGRRERLARCAAAQAAEATESALVTGVDHCADQGADRGAVTTPK